MRMNLPLKLLITAAFFNSLLWIILIPVWQYPDEQAHFAQVQDVAEVGHVPNEKFDTSQEISISEKILETERDSLGNNKFTYHPEYKLKYSTNLYGPWEKVIADLNENSRKTFVKNEATQNPPIYYFLGAQIYQLFSGSNLFERVYAVRFLSLFFFLSTIAVSYHIGLSIFSKDRILSFVLAAAIAFKPMFVFANTGILPDSLTNFLFSTVLFFSLKILIFGLRTVYLVPIILILILGVYTRQHFIASIPVISFPIIYHVFKNRNYYKKGILAVIGLIIFFIFANTFGTTLPFFNNFRFPETSQLNFKPIFSLNFIKYLVQFIRHSITETFPWYWGVYKWLSLTVPHVNYQIINRIILIAIVGIIIKLALVIRKKLSISQLILSYLIWGTLIYIFLFAVWDFIFINFSGFSFGFQGRYYFPLVAFHMSIILMGVIQVSNILFKKNSKYTLLVIIILVICFNNVSLAYVASSYYSTSSLSQFIIESSQYKPVIFKGNIISLILSVSLVFQSILIITFAKFLKSKNNYIMNT